MTTPINISSISALHQALGLNNPTNPLISVFDLDEVAVEPDRITIPFTSDLYFVALKKDCAGGIQKYGQGHYDFEEGMMYFIAPQQVLQFNEIVLASLKGFVLVVHPDFLHGSPMLSKIKDYRFFGYSNNEALFLSEKEEQSIMEIIENMKREINNNMDAFTQDLLISNLDLLLKYCDRYYNRQFLTRKKVNSDLLTKLESLLDEYFQQDKLVLNGIPTVQFAANELNLSPNYLSDMLRVQTGKTTQQHIQERILDKAKELLSTTNKSVSEIAFELGFEHAQSFHRLFKKRTSVSPLDFRQSFN
ncbi:helix-turn-helix transcriptional regulator [Soonwooa sp.]|uniref:helix-turn-helix domain-containing protein n=1 Tax=Soonwooa sp. TaxID=1938592 RepID=UPI00261A3CA4|nr:helix-turn-helix transcriptional regulator [Soonwooa sp.]